MCGGFRHLFFEEKLANGLNKLEHKVEAALFKELYRWTGSGNLKEKVGMTCPCIV
jgi:hypothetical protein